jgi:hypothetical protein
MAKTNKNALEIENLKNEEVLKQEINQSLYERLRVPIQVKNSVIELHKNTKNSKTSDKTN